MSNEKRGHAVVLGAGVAGLFAARVVAESHAKVTLIDRDELSVPVSARRGLPQAGHLHGLLARGQQIMEEHFPGITEELIADGAQHGDVARDVRWIINGRHLRRADSGLTVITCTRPFLERHIRERLLEVPEVELSPSTDLLRLVTAPDGRTVTGVVVERGGVEEEVPADLVVDATGRGSRTPLWLAELGFGRPEEEKHKIGLGYTTRFYRTSHEAFEGDISINTVASAGIPRGTICQKVDGGRTIVTAYGILGDHAATTPDGFMEFIGSLAAPDIQRVLERSEPITDPVQYRFPTNLRRHYERLTDFPEGLLVIGDAVCSFNPSYAQGMTVAAMSSLVLRRHLAQEVRPAPTSYFKSLAEEAVDGVWQMAVGADLSFPEVEGVRDEAVLRAHEHVTRVQHAAALSGEVAARYARVIGLVDPPSALGDPEFLELLDRVEAAGAKGTETAEVEGARR
ncbi:MAG: FAD-dependent monooxygenase [Nocardiopsis sp. BM-2018]|uniref:2-polyprenyl-6-methoxyphenol hydroxylase-like FAD-dependent oxidoreductase n=1 Tax=Nocardiopsis metallicus TaxID=179819 RepID=A0A840WCH6_9ACTN|nr:FAD-dependent monooxygenase [Nocardiopsis metallicus]MBB5489715.1 2-polyprenyl-6-methoxyphenol hydroxylase-like FAD-dependent oxidoreductase [Nocardiopsis metallicus]QRN79725.1 MAG: FAD-dependent monooxygenase [Nocardiopsis sp. BM-2018]